MEKNKSKTGINIILLLAVVALMVGGTTNQSTC